MSKVIFSTFLMMGGAFVIGLAVAYLIKLISLLLNYFESYSLSANILLRKRYHSILKIRRTKLRLMLHSVEESSKNELLEHFYSHQQSAKNTNPNDNELIRYYYGKY